MLLQSPWKPRLADIQGSPAERLVHALAEDILSGQLTRGDRLPAHRDLAWSLDIGVGTVTKAYAILERRGLTRSEKGRGTFVGPCDVSKGPRVDLAVNAPPAVLSRKLLARSLQAIGRRADADQFNLYAPPAGHLEHRALIARWLATLGLQAQPTQIVLTGGAQQALALAFDAVCGRDGVLLTERVTYPGAITLCRHTGTEMRGVAMDAEGMQADALAQALDAVPNARRKAVYLTPNLHNPTTATMGMARRQAIASICCTRGVPIIEDGVYTTGVDEPPALAMLAPQQTWHVGSLSKTVSPGLRLGFLVTPRNAEEALGLALPALALSPSPLAYQVVEDWLANGTMDSIRGEMMQEAARRVALANTLLKGRALVSHPQAFHIWLPMPAPVAKKFADAAAGLGIAVTPPEAMLVNPSDADSGVRLCLGIPSWDELTQALQLLADLG